MQKPRRPTMQDIADHVGVTKMTVSRYLRSPEKVAPKTGEKIAAALEEIGYIPNCLPNILSNQCSQTLGVILPSLSHPVFQGVIRGIESVAEESGYQLMYAQYDYDQAVEEKRIETLLSFNVDGLILAGSDHSARSQKMLKTAGVPVVEMMDASETSSKPSVGVDNTFAARSMVTMMIERGYKHIVCLSAKKGIFTREKTQGYVDAMESHSLTPRSLAAKSMSSVFLARQMTRKVLERYPETDAFFCTDDEIAAGVLLECQRQSINVPEDIGIAGVHALDIGQSMMPRLASIVTPDRQTGEKAMLSLLAQIQGVPHRTAPLEFELDEGESLLPEFV
ncbi:LacI family DNA-binding transcriptional regulator [Enterovibrio norvegicus]|uniref:LacI family DNA-binding transcriptional regulator n=1 Tax=Enterovibrio norvegicus TaxID=188144 RepID=A0ABV4L174_9GAMM|nr:LacI family DNA-binding transcriptional regulator [Enterovibrio norvegicus]OEE58678.1 transcriptional regulator [Enterovibrio norvegicus]PMH63454.1 transcriptional regulator [Enterovibrio norvegicus]TKF35153.1 LacI family DNA-binding transcriptional regulator [Enterovibrio norvegicus]